MGDNFKLSTSDEEEDLDALRLAALQSLKRKAQSGGESGSMNQFGSFSDQNFNPLKGKQRKGKFFRQMPRVPRNGQFNSWARNSNLISVPMISAEEKSPEAPKTDAPKLILPQDRYCKTLKEDEATSNSPVSKFDRYDNSDGSESDSDEEVPRPSSETTSTLKRSDSLEALMAELESEIQGEAKLKPKKKKSAESSDKVTISAKENLKPKVVEAAKIEVAKVETAKPVVVEIPKTVTTEPKKSTNGFQRRKWQQGMKPRRHNYAAPPTMDFQQSRLCDVIIPFVPPPIPQFPSYAPPMPYDACYQSPPPMIYEPPRFTELPPIRAPYERPLSPLIMNTDAFSTTTLAPLSPRSAAFVLENRAIIEKRKRRSYSRSPSPRFRRSKSPKRSSISPPKRVRSLSPVRKVLPPKKPIHDRLGTKPTKPDGEVKETVKEDKKLEDPVLEARRKKFENNEITIKEGVIRLRAKEEIDQNDDKEEVVDEDALLEDVDDTIEIDTKDDVLFSDEESNSDNEGRFKAKQEIGQKVAVLPFVKLINGSKSVAKPTEKPRNRRKRYRSRSPATLPKKVTVVAAARRVEKAKPVAFPIDNKKIEIKIRNPAKYEGEGEEKLPSTGRKVEIAKKPEAEVASLIAAEVVDVNEGDLRAQLSRKRAERQKHPLPDVVPSRLLQNALKGVGFKKAKKSKTKEKDLIKDGKLPIHLRLGTANGPEAFPKKTRKHKNRGSQEQV